MGAYLLETDANLRLVNFSPFFFTQTCFMSRLDSWWRSTAWSPKLRRKGFEILDAEVRIKDPGQARSFLLITPLTFSPFLFLTTPELPLLQILIDRTRFHDFVVSSTGSKNHIANLILRYYGVKQGSVRIGEGVRNYDCTVRSQIGMVSQIISF